MGEIKKVRVINAPNGWWTEGRFGEVFDVVRVEDYTEEGWSKPEKAYYVRLDDEHRWILAKDCEIVDGESAGKKPAGRRTPSMSEKYPKYYKDVRGIVEVDVYAVHQLFGIDDPSGAIHHASKKLLLSGVRTGGKSKYDDVKEARDTLTRWLDMAKADEG